MALVLLDAMTDVGARTRRRVRRASEDGIVVVYVALAIVMLLGVTAIAIDVGNGWQQQRYAQSVADSAALSAAQGLSDAASQCAGWVAGANCAYEQGFYYAFGSLNLPRPTTGQSCGTDCETYTDMTAKKTVVIYTNWQNNADWVHVRVCWSIPTFFGKVVGVSTLSPCGDATAQVSATPPTQTTGCTPNELGGVSTLQAGAGTVSGTMSATYTSTTPLNVASVSFIATNAYGQLVTLQAPGSVATAADPVYALTDNGGTNGALTDVTISYQVPANLVTATGSLFVTDSSGDRCGIVAWTTCQIISNDDFFEPPSTGGKCHTPVVCTQNDGDDATTSPADLEADAADVISPKPNVTISPGASFAAQFFDETPLNPASVVLAVDGTMEPLTFLPWGTGGPAGTTPVPLPSNSSLANDGCSTATTACYGVGSANVSAACDGTTNFGSGSFAAGQCRKGSYGGTGTRVCQPGAATPSSTVVVTMCDYLGDGLPGKIVQLSPNGGSATVACTTSPGTLCVTRADGSAGFTVTDPTNETVTFTAKDLSDGVDLAQTIKVSFSGGTPSMTITPGPSQTACAGSSLASCAILWTQTQLGGVDTGNFAVFPSYTLGNSLADGWHSAFVYMSDTDQNKAGGDCAMTQWPFEFTGGKGSISLVQ